MSHVSYACHKLSSDYMKFVTWQNKHGTCIKQRYQWQWYKWIEKNHNKRSRSKFNSSELVGDSQRKSLRFNQLWSSRWRSWDFGIRWERYNKSVQNGRKIFEYDFDPFFHPWPKSRLRPTQFIPKWYWKLKRPWQLRVEWSRIASHWCFGGAREHHKPEFMRSPWASLRIYFQFPVLYCL